MLARDLLFLPRFPSRYFSSAGCATHPVFLRHRPFFGGYCRCELLSQMSGRRTARKQTGPSVPPFGTTVLSWREAETERKLRTSEVTAGHEPGRFRSGADGTLVLDG